MRRKGEVALEGLLRFGKQFFGWLADGALGQVLLVPYDAAGRRKLKNAPVHVAVPKEIAATGLFRRRRQLAVEEFRIRAIHWFNKIGNVDIPLGVEPRNGAVEALPDECAARLAVLADGVQREELAGILGIARQVIGVGDDVDLV